MAEIIKQTPSMISTSKGFFDILRPWEYEYDVREIAHSLSHLCRYTGHVPRFYCVAEHCVLVSKLVPPEHALAGLLHDASEAFVGDVSSPLKKLLRDYKPIEEEIQAALCSHFNVAFPFHESVKKADAEAYWLERASVAKPPKGAEDKIYLQEYKKAKGPKPLGLPPVAAEMDFMDRYWEIMDDRAKSVLREGSPETASA